MTAQEAIKIIERVDICANAAETARDMAIGALKKQIPQKPIRDSLADRACPVCDAYIPFDALNDDIAYAPKFCKHCGQALDWGKDNA